MCIFNLAFREKLNCKLSTYDFLFLWTDSICTFELPFWEQLKSQIEHFCNLHFSWTDSVFFQITFFRATIITKWALKGLFVLINWFTFYFWAEFSTNFKYWSIKISIHCKKYWDHYQYQYKKKIKYQYSVSEFLPKNCILKETLLLKK